MKIINKDITTLKKGILLQQVNCQNAMGSGVAKAIYTKWPIVKEEYHKFAQNKNPNDLLGLIQEIKINEDLLIKNIKEIANKYSNKTIVIPYLIGCGLGGGNWNYIFENIKNINNLLICKY